MNAFARVGLLFLFLGAGLFAAEDPKVQVAASRELRLAIIDSSKASPARDAMHQAFADSLGAAVSERCGDKVGVRFKCVSADHAAFNLATGVYDAALVVGSNIPEPLRRANGIRLSGTPQSGTRERTITLIVNDGDLSLQGMLATAFTAALANERFLESLDGGKKLPGSTTVAAAD